MIGNIFNIQKFCVNDGPGIRTTVFLKGCPLRCVWCHNPESQSPQKQLLFYPEKCMRCGQCADAIQNDDNFSCLNSARIICGKTVTSEEIVAEVMKDNEFYKNSGGGITLSGGEPLFQFDFACELLQMSKAKGLHTAIETCGFIESESISRIAQYVDLFLFDFKETNPVLHKKFTGQDNDLILKNLSLLNKMKKDILLRCPIIPGYNDRQEHYDEICRIANMMEHVIGIEIEPYHIFGENKYSALGKQKPRIVPMSNEGVCKIIEYIALNTTKEVKKA